MRDIWNRLLVRLRLRRPPDPLVITIDLRPLRDAFRGAIAAVAGWFDAITRPVAPTTTQIIDRLGVTEADIRDVTWDRSAGVYVVRLWNHRRLTIEPTTP